MQILKWKGRLLRTSGLKKINKKREHKVMDNLLTFLSKSLHKFIYNLTFSSYFLQLAWAFLSSDFWCVRLATVEWTWLAKVGARDDSNHKSTLYFTFLNCSSNFFIRNLLSLISCFAYTIQLIKKYRAYIWPKKEIIFKEGKQFKVFTGRDLMTLSKKKIIWGFRKLGPRELWSYQMLIIQYIIIELNPHCLDPSFIFLFRNPWKGAGKGHVLIN